MPKVGKPPEPDISHLGGTDSIAGVEAVDLPIDPEFAGLDVEQVAGEEVSAMLALFRERALDAERRFTDNTDSEYWIAIGFQNRAQKEEFLTKAGLISQGDKFLDGMKVAAALGIELTTEIPSMPRFGVDSKLNYSAQPLDKPYPKVNRG